MKQNAIGKGEEVSKWLPLTSSATLRRNDADVI
jgi:hypothetical protein